MGVDAADYRRNGRSALAVTNFDNEMIGLYEWEGKGFVDRARERGVGPASKDRLGFGCLFGDLNLDGYLDLVAVNGHIDDTVRNVGRRPSHAQVPHLFLNQQGQGGAGFRDIAQEAGAAFAQPKIGRGLALGDFDRDGDLDLLLTTNGGRVHLYRNDLGRGPEQHSVLPGGAAIEPRCDWRGVAVGRRGGPAKADGEERVQLSFSQVRGA